MDKTTHCFNVAEVSEQTGLSISLVRKLTRKDEIPHIKIGRRILYPADALVGWLNKNTVGGTTPDKGGAANG
ncbi:helix-turn-helix domain-containing protein [Ruminococcus flavefaciens]|uniref:DNA binding domain-containing protein, excisionase family n=1 Tax=Ruminococcus flavefaciens TaxID=1265 RepID=A0A1M7II26_RUMFL|nr:helix-turn-helix domain-containing protein [Ruminococcus flavefaciens]SHM40442.1 DNA binding domain-containing protein, excisionase family [Ruminococcus flavefaciens]